MNQRSFLKIHWFYGVFAGLVTGPIITALAQKQPYVTNIRMDVDTLGKRVRFTYDLAKALPDDSLYLQIETPDNIFYPKAVDGDIGTNLTPGTNRTVYWSPLADGRKIDADVRITFMVRTYAQDTLMGRRRGLLLTKQQLITYGRWAVSACLTGITVAKTITLIRDIKAYQHDDPPNNALKKQETDQRSADLANKKRQLYPWVAASVVSLLANVVYSYALKKRPPRKPPRVSWQGNGSSLTLAYTF